MASKSASESSNSSSTANADNRVAVDGTNNTALGSGATYNNEFSPDVAAFANKVLDFASGVMEGGANVLSKTVSENQTTTAAAVTAAAQGNANIISQIGPYMLVGAGLVAVYLIVKMKRG